MVKPELKNVIEDYLSEADLRETLHDPKVDLCFKFIYPKGKKPQYNPVGGTFMVFKSKEKNYLEISTRVSISKKNIKKFNSMDKIIRDRFFKKIVKTFLLKGYYYSFDLVNYKYVLKDHIFIDENKMISRDKFFKRLRKMNGCIMYSIFEIQDFCSGEFDISDLSLAV